MVTLGAARLSRIVGDEASAQLTRCAAASALGLRVGLLDADVHGPSIPTLMNLRHSGSPALEGDAMLPMENHGVRCMSVGLLIPDGGAAVWRGPMVMGALGKMIRDTKWGALDVLFVDMPPGSGDAHISISQQLPLSGAVIVSTPQKLALADVARTLAVVDSTRPDRVGRILRAWEGDALWPCVGLRRVDLADAVAERRARREEAAKRAREREEAHRRDGRHERLDARRQHHAHQGTQLNGQVVDARERQPERLCRLLARSLAQQILSDRGEESMVIGEVCPCDRNGPRVTVQ